MALSRSAAQLLVAVAFACLGCAGAVSSVKIDSATVSLHDLPMRYLDGSSEILRMAVYEVKFTGDIYLMDTTSGVQFPVSALSHLPPVNLTQNNSFDASNNNGGATRSVVDHPEAQGAKEDLRQRLKAKSQAFDLSGLRKHKGKTPSAQALSAKAEKVRRAHLLSKKENSLRQTASSTGSGFSGGSGADSNEEVSIEDLLPNVTSAALDGLNLEIACSADGPRSTYSSMWADDRPPPVDFLMMTAPTSYPLSHVIKYVLPGVSEEQEFVPYRKIFPDQPFDPRSLVFIRLVGMMDEHGNDLTLEDHQALEPWMCPNCEVKEAKCYTNYWWYEDPCDNNTASGSREGAIMAGLEKKLRDCAWGSVSLKESALAQPFGYKVVDVSGQAIVDTKSIDEVAPQCSVAELRRFSDEYNKVITLLRNATTENDAKRGLATLTLLEAHTGFSACRAQVRELVTSQSYSVAVAGTRECTATGANGYCSDPCCNPSKEFQTCCAPQDVTVQLDLIDGFNETRIASQCSDDSSAKGACLSYGYISSVQDNVYDGCSATRKKEVSAERLELLMNFTNECFDILFSGKTKSGASSCKADEECYTTCEAARGFSGGFGTAAGSGASSEESRCQSPYIDWEGPFFHCAVDKMDETLTKFMKKMVGLPLAATTDELKEKLLAEEAQEDCKGVTAYQGACMLETTQEQCESQNIFNTLWDSSDAHVWINRSASSEAECSSLGSDYHWLPIKTYPSFNGGFSPECRVTHSGASDFQCDAGGTGGAGTGTGSGASCGSGSQDTMVTSNGLTALARTFVDGCASCHVLTDNTGSIADGCGSNLYPNDFQCCWIIAPSQKAFRLVFDVIDTERWYDYVHIFTCSDSSCTNSSLLDAVSGYNTNMAYWPNNGVLKIEFASDYIVQGAGFSACWGPVQCGDGFRDDSGSERCDDGNTADGDGCSSTCQIETGYFCEPNSLGGDTCTAGSSPPPSSTPSGGTTGGNSPGGGSSNTFCSGVVTYEQTSGTLTDGSGVANYLNNQDCTWIINATAGGPLKIQVDHFRTEHNFDYVYIYQCTFTTCLTGTKELVKASGVDADAEVFLFGANYHDGSSPPETILINSGIAKIQFTTDGSVTQDGFEFSWSSVTLNQCGNSFREDGEACDDGNVINGDGCDSTCVVESGYTCYGATNRTGPDLCEVDYQQVSDGVSTCKTECVELTALSGSITDGAADYVNDLDCCWILSPRSLNASQLLRLSLTSMDTEPNWDFLHVSRCHSNPCDSTNTDLVAKVSGSTEFRFGVDSAMHIQFTTDGSVTYPGFVATWDIVDSNVCGNGIVEAGEDCDDGNSVDSDGCSVTCTVECGYTCEPEYTTTRRRLLQTADGMDYVNYGTTFYSSTDRVGPSFCQTGSSSVGTSSDQCTASCNGLTDATGTLTDGSGMSNYANYLDCSWILAPTNAMNIQFTLTYMDTEAYYDFVTFYECDDENCHTKSLLGSVSGSTLYSVRSSTGILKVEFTSDHTYTLSGFEGTWTANYTASCGDGFVDPSESCDDGNTASSDGCSSSCQIESNFNCDSYQTCGSGSECGEQGTGTRRRLLQAGGSGSDDGTGSGYDTGSGYSSPYWGECCLSDTTKITAVSTCNGGGTATGSGGTTGGSGSYGSGGGTASGSGTTNAPTPAPGTSYLPSGLNGGVCLNTGSQCSAKYGDSTTYCNDLPECYRLKQYDIDTNDYPWTILGWPYLYPYSVYHLKTEWIPHSPVSAKCKLQEFYEMEDYYYYGGYSTSIPPVQEQCERAARIFNATLGYDIEEDTSEFLRFSNKVRGYWDEDTDSWREEIVEKGSKENCEMDRRCSHRLYESGVTAAECSGVENDNFCGECDGPWCYERSVFPRCHLHNANKDECSLHGGTWIQEETSAYYYSGYYYTDMGMTGGYHATRCFDCCRLPATTEATCFASPICGTNSHTCEEFDICYEDVVESSCVDDDNDGWPQWSTTITDLDTTTGFCVHGWKHAGDDAAYEYGKSTKKACNTVSGAVFHPGRKWRDGQFHTEELCRVCASQPYDWDAAKDIAQCPGSCSKGCPRCEADYWSARDQVCIYTQYTTESQCTGASLQWGHGDFNTDGSGTDGVCWSETDDSQCQNSGTVVGCAGLSRNECYDSSTTYGLPWHVLSCWWNDWAPCTQESECVGQGECSDWQYQNWYYGGDTNGAADEVCRVPWKYGDAWGYPDWRQCSCDNSGGYYHDACIIYGIDVAECTLFGGEMVSRAKDKTSCEKQKACFRQDDFYPTITAIGEADCTNANLEGKCDQTLYEWRSVNTWSEGIWYQPRHANLTWRARDMVPANTWSRFLTTSQLYAVAQKAIINMVSDAFTSETRCLIEPLLTIFNATSCNCGSDRDSYSCASAISSVATIKEGTWFAGSTGLLKSNLATVTVNATELAKDITANSNPNGELLKVSLGYISPYLNGIQSTASNTRRQSGVSVSCADFEFVKNTNGDVIGQVVGSAMVITGLSNAEATVCLKLADSESIPQCDFKYPIIDFAPGLSNNQPGVPLQTTITMDRSNKACGKVSAAQVSNNGQVTVWPVLRTADMLPHVVHSGPVVKRSMSLSYASKDLFTLARRNTFKQSVAQVLKNSGVQVSENDVVILKVCDSTGCIDFVNRRRGSRRSTDSITVEYQVQIPSGVDESAVASAVDSGSFTSSFEAEMASRGETVTAGSATPGTTAAPGTTATPGSPTTTPEGSTAAAPPPEDEDDGGGLGGGAIAGIAIGGVAGLALIGGGAMYFSKRGGGGGNQASQVSNGGIRAPLDDSNPVVAVAADAGNPVSRMEAKSVFASGVAMDASRVART